MKQNKILSALGLASTAQHSTLRQFTKRIVQVTAFTVSCLVILPSFVQTADAQTCDGSAGCWEEGVTAYGYYDPWGNWNGWGDEGQGCQDIGCDSSDDGGDGGTSNNGAVCVSQEELTQNIQVCVVATLGATGAAVGILNGAACSTCFITPNIASCGTCAVLTVFTGFAVNLAASQCQPPEMEVCP